MSTLALVLGSLGAAFCGYFSFMLTAFGGGGLVAPGRPPLSKSVERYLAVSLLGGPALCVVFGVLAWITRNGWCFAGPPALCVLQFAVILGLMGRK